VRCRTLSRPFNDLVHVSGRLLRKNGTCSLENRPILPEMFALSSRLTFPHRNCSMHSVPLRPQSVTALPAVLKLKAHCHCQIERLMNIFTFVLRCLNGLCTKITLMRLCKPFLNIDLEGTISLLKVVRSITDTIPQYTTVFFFNRCTVPFEIYAVHTPTNAPFINLVKSSKFTLEYIIISLLHVSVFNGRHQGALSVPN